MNHDITKECITKVKGIAWFTVDLEKLKNKIENVILINFDFKISRWLLGFPLSLKIKKPNKKTSGHGTAGISESGSGQLPYA